MLASSTCLRDIRVSPCIRPVRAERRRLEQERYSSDGPEITVIGAGQSLLVVDGFLAKGETEPGRATSGQLQGCLRG